jgi:hypothetical protein
MRRYLRDSGDGGGSGSGSGSTALLMTPTTTATTTMTTTTTTMTATTVSATSTTLHHVESWLARADALTQQQAAAKRRINVTHDVAAWRRSDFNFNAYGGGGRDFNACGGGGRNNPNDGSGGNGGGSGGNGGGSGGSSSHNVISGNGAHGGNGGNGGGSNCGGGNSGGGGGGGGSGVDEHALHAHTRAVVDSLNALPGVVAAVVTELQTGITMWRAAADAANQVGHSIQSNVCHPCYYRSNHVLCHQVASRRRRSKSGGLLNSIKRVSPVLLPF